MIHFSDERYYLTKLNFGHQYLDNHLLPGIFFLKYQSREMYALQLMHVSDETMSSH